MVTASGQEFSVSLLLLPQFKSFLEAAVRVAVSPLQKGKWVFPGVAKNIEEENIYIGCSFQIGSSTGHLELG